MKSLQALILANKRFENSLLAKSEQQCNLFTDFKANPGGQERFFELTKWRTIEPLEQRWTGLIGGIGCVGAETLVNDVSIAERTHAGMVDTMSGKSIATAGYLKGKADLYRVRTRGNRDVIVTLDHRFLAGKRWCKLRHLKIGDFIASDGTARGLPSFGWDIITDISFVRHDDFYDLHVPVHNHYSAHGLWHHNSGKSFCGAVWTISRALLDPQSRGLIAANTFGQLSRSTLTTLVEVARLYCIPLEPRRESIEDQALAIANAQRCYIGKDRAFSYVLSMNSFTGKTQSSRGLQVRYAWLDESGWSSEQSFLTLDGRLGRGRGTLKGQGVITTSPNSYNWLYDRFADPQRGPEKERLYVMVNCSTRENVKHLGEDYVAGLQANYTEELAAQELEGAFVNITVGRVYKSFLRSRDILQGRDAIDFGYNPQEDIHVSLDFNWNPACAVAAHVRNKQEVFFVREFRLANSDTFELSDAICKWLLEMGHRGRIYVHGDASGAARSANSRLTNWEIVWNALKSHGLKERASKCYGIQNPNVLDTVLSVNSLFAHERMFICGDRCPNLVKDLEQVAWKDDGTTVDKSNPELTHLSDCLRYLVYDEFPYKRQTSHQKTALRAVAGIAP